MTEPQTRIDGVRQQGCAVDADRTLVTAIAVDLMGASIWLVERDGQAKRIGKTPAGCPKIDSAFPRAFPDGTARLCMAQADVGGGGATSHLTWIDFPDAFPPQSSAVAAPIWKPEGGPVQVFTQKPFDGEVTIDLDAHGIPLCNLLSLELTISGVEQRGGSVNGVAAYVQSGGRATVTPTVPPGAGNTLTLRSIGTGGLEEFLVKVVVGW